MWTAAQVRSRLPCLRLAGLIWLLSAGTFFLDNNRNVDAIARQLREAVKIARSRHKVVVICHPYPETIKALRQEAAYLHQQDIQVCASITFIAALIAAPAGLKI